MGTHIPSEIDTTHHRDMILCPKYLSVCSTVRTPAGSDGGEHSAATVPDVQTWMHTPNSQRGARFAADVSIC